MIPDLNISLESERALLRPLSKADERNRRSRQAILGIGATREGVLREHIKLHDGYIRNTVYYSILRSEWDTIKVQYFANFASV
ncbi:MAG: GNAT family N-acetyltransferase [Daejeonella sp.]